MREVYVDFNAKEASQYCLGHIREHNATKIIFTPPKRLSEDIRTLNYRLVFQCGNKQYRTHAYSVWDETIEVILSSAFTQSGSLSVQMVAYDENDEYIGKSDIISGFTFKPSLSGSSMTPSNTSDDVIQEITNNTKENQRQFLADLNIRLPEDADVSNFLYDIDYSDYIYDYEFAEKEFETNYDYKLGACATIIKNGLIGRKYDWTYDWASTFRIKTPAVAGRFASIGTAQHPKLTRDIVNNRIVELDGVNYIKFYKLLPFLTLDGINENHVYCDIKVSQLKDRGETIGTNPDGNVLCGLAIVRYILDFATSAAHAISLLSNLNIWFPHTENLNEEFHYTIADPTTAYVVEFSDNQMFYHEAPDGLIVTNFSVVARDGETWFDGNYIPRNEATKYTKFFKSTEHPMGIERFDIVKGLYSSIVDKESMLSVLEAIKYTNTYSENMSPIWYSEFSADLTPAGYGDLAWGTPLSNYIPLIEHMRELFNEERLTGERTGKTWQTVHDAIYDIANGEFSIWTQENYDDEFSMSLREKTEVPWEKIINTPTTIAGYGINDAYTKTEVDAKVTDATEIIELKRVGIFESKYTPIEIRDTLAGKHLMWDGVNILHVSYGYVPGFDGLSAFLCYITSYNAQGSTDQKEITPSVGIIFVRPNGYAQNVTPMKSFSTNDFTNELKTALETAVQDVTQLKSGITQKQDKLTAGTNITIDANNVISAEGGSGGVPLDEDSTVAFALGYDEGGLYIVTEDE